MASLLTRSLAARTTPARAARGAELYAAGRVVYAKRVHNWFRVIVRGEKNTYIVHISQDGSRYHCSCADYARTGLPCKHIIAAALYIDAVIHGVAAPLRALGLALRRWGVVDRPGFEPGTSRVRTERSSRLSYRPTSRPVPRP